MEYVLDSVGFPGYTLVVLGTAQGSDILWNNLCADVQVRNKDGSETLECEISQFTHNCGIKAIARLYPSGESASERQAVCKKLWPMIEAFIAHKTNGGMLVASDGVGGAMTPLLKATGWKESSDPIHNPNYGRHGGHPVVLWHKNILDTYDSANHGAWQALCSGKLEGAAPAHQYYAGHAFSADRG